ncbi:hypothetical protein HOP50_10g60770 [Chloropicon primus]|uniref:DUF2421 domain-containing protein n=2 Tax=Chloropicon primus TaxID=1764295 RepID=A0A5B8MS42_9CHLO|nr:hypothetical protein A3770_10p60560 [Chloropicon primus]UPR02750.1 hypothetical protein HOP50_10g60770 [Chloropicon primus]|eukprot:QDZ23538.1 hypothetical protein A3770_10p60560 [Chloropicon primus]
MPSEGEDVAVDVKDGDGEDTWRTSASRCWDEARGFACSTLGKGVLRSWLCLTIPAVLFYVPAVNEWLGKQAFLMVLLAITTGLLATPCCVGVVTSFTLKVVVSLALGQAYGLLCIAVTADHWPGILAFVFVISFVSSYTLRLDFQWGVGLCLAGTVFGFTLIKAQYQVFFQNGLTGWEVRPQVLNFSLEFMKSVLKPACMGLAIPLVVNLTVFPQLMYLQFNTILIHLCRGVGELWDCLLEQHFSDVLHPDATEWHEVYKHARAVFQSADRLPALLAVSKIEGAFSFSKRGSYQSKVVRPLMQLVYNICYMTRVLTRFQAPGYIPDPSIKEEVAYGVAREADKVLHSLEPGSEDESKARAVGEKFQQSVEPALQIYTDLVRQNLKEVLANLEHFDKKNVRPGRRTDRDDNQRREAADDIVAGAMKTIFRESSHDIRCWFKSRGSFLSSFTMTALRSTHALSLACARNTEVRDQDVFAKYFSFRALQHMMWMQNQTDRTLGDPRLLRRRPSQARAEGGFWASWVRIAGRCLSAFVNWMRGQDFKLALRTAIAVTITAGFGFFPPTAASFDAISGLIAVAFVLFDAGSPYQGHFLTKTGLRFIGNGIGMLWSVAAYHSARIAQTQFIQMLFLLVLILFLVFVMKVVAAKSSHHQMDLLFFSLYTYTTFVALLYCTKDCQFDQFILQRFWNLLIAVAVASVFNLLVFPMRAETAMRSLAAKTLYDIGMIYVYLTTVKSKSAQADSFRHTMACLSSSSKLQNLLAMADREIRTDDCAYSHREYEALFSDVEYICRTLAWSSTNLQLLGVDPTEKDIRQYEKIRSHTFTMMLSCSYCLQTKDVYPPHALKLELTSKDLQDLVDELTTSRFVADRAIFDHPDHMFLFDLRRVVLILNHLCKDAKQRCENLFGTVSFVESLKLD